MKKTRLSMKLLWKLLLEYQKGRTEQSNAAAFLAFVEKEMKKPLEEKKLKGV